MKWCLNEGLGGWALLLVVAVVAALVALGALLGLFKLLEFAADLIRSLGSGWKNAGDD